MVPRRLLGASATGRLSLVVRRFRAVDGGLGRGVGGGGQADDPAYKELQAELEEYKKEVKAGSAELKAFFQEYNAQIAKLKADREADYAALKEREAEAEKEYTAFNQEIKAQFAEIRAGQERNAAVLRSIIKHTLIPIQLTILTRYSSMLLLTHHPNDSCGPGRTLVPHRIGLLKTRQDTEREIDSLMARINSSRAAYGSEPEGPHEIAFRMLSLRQRFGVLGLERESDVVWLASEVSRLL